MKTLTTIDQINQEVAKLQYSPTFQINFSEIQISTSKGKPVLKFIISYENTNNQKEFYREFKVEVGHPIGSYAQARIRAERLQQGIVTKKPLSIGSL